MIPRSPNRINAFLYTSTGYFVFFFRDTLMLGFGSGDWYFFRHQVTGRRDRGCILLRPQGYKNGMLGNQQILTPIDREGGERQKRTVFPGELQSVF